jgi:hypothetical protein
MAKQSKSTTKSPAAPSLVALDARRKLPEQRVVRKQITFTPEDMQIIGELGKRWKTTKIVTILRAAIRQARG